jgi:hypothetical protein
VLADYTYDVRDLLRDQNAQFFSTTAVTRYINRARSQVAQDTACIRILVAGGSPYGADATVGTAVVGGAVPGAIGNPMGTTVFNTIPGQEYYPYSYANSLIAQQNAGVKGIIDVNSVSVSWGSSRPTLAWMPWEELQAYARAWMVNNQNYPSIFSTMGSGETGQVWLYPIPGTVAEMEWLCTCSPAALNTDSDPEALPRPFTECVKWYAVKLAYEASQRWQAASVAGEEYANHVRLACAAENRGKIPSMYDEY